MSSPFSTEYLEEEIAFYNPQLYEKDGVKLILKPIKGACRIDEYLNVMLWTEGPDIPVLMFNDTLWMSLTWMEVQSFWVARQEFEGVVLMGGLGMGYAALRLAAKPEVEKVVVYEIDSRVIEFFEETQKGRPEMDKIEIRVGDVHEAEGKYDYAFIDIYATLLPDELREDAQFFLHDASEKLEVGQWCFWGQEAIWFNMLERGESPNITRVESVFFGLFSDYEHSNLKPPMGDGNTEFSEEVHYLLRGDTL
jgi:hypothetical protein